MGPRPIDGATSKMSTLKELRAQLDAASGELDSLIGTKEFPAKVQEINRLEAQIRDAKEAMEVSARIARPIRAGENDHNALENINPMERTMRSEERRVGKECRSR